MRWCRMARWLLTILTGGGGVAADGRHANNAEGYAEQRPIEWPSTAAWTILSSPFFPFLRSSARGGSIEGSRTRSNFRFEDAYEEDARDIPVSTCHAYVRAAAESRRRATRAGWNWKGASSRGSKFGVNWGRGKKRGSESGGGTVSGRWQFYGNADICITRAPTRYRRVCKPAFLHLMYTFHVAANCTGRRKDSRASARRYYVTCRSIMIPPLR